MALYDLNWLNKGQVFPPLCEKERINEYENNRKLYEGLYGEVDFYKTQFNTRLADDLGQYNVLTNELHRQYSNKVSELLFGTPPAIIAGNDEQQNVIDELKHAEDIFDILEKSAIDISRNGATVFHTYLEDGDVIIDTIDPKYWFPIVSKLNVNKILNHVIAFDTEDAKGNSILIVDIHSKGSYEHRIYRLKKMYDGNIIDDLIEGPTVIKNGLDGFAIIPVVNASTTDNIYGRSDYDDIYSSTVEIFIRQSKIAKILDAHADPIQIIPESAVEYDEDTGSYYFKMQNALIMKNKDDVKPEKLTWNGELESSENELKRWWESFYNETLGPMVMGASNIPTLANISGATLRELNKTAISKITNLQKKYNTPLIKIIKNALKLSNKNIDSISIRWAELFGDTQDEILARIDKRLADGTMSKIDAIMLLDGITKDEAREKLAEIQSEQTLHISV